jgi:hypothetical protein
LTRKKDSVILIAETIRRASIASSNWVGQLEHCTVRRVVFRYIAALLSALLVILLPSASVRSDRAFSATSSSPGRPLRINSRLASTGCGAPPWKDATRARSLKLDDGGSKSFYYRPEDIQMPKLPEDAVKSEPKPEEDWVVDYVEAPARQPEQKILY